MLANEATKLCRGEEAAKAAEATARETFAGGGAGEDLPTVEVDAEGVRLGAACTALGFTASNGEAKRKIAEGSEEWQVMHRRYYEQEMARLGIDLRMPETRES